MNNIANALGMNSRGGMIIWIITAAIFFVLVLILAKRLSDSIREAALNNGKINQYLAAVPADKIGTINAIYENSKKNLGIALLLTIVGGTFGFHQIYLGKRKSAVFMFMFFWTGIPTIISLFNLSVMPRTVSEFNLNVVKSLYDQLSAPKLEN